jgi:phage tail-like protein
MENEIFSSYYFTVEIDGIQADRFFSCEGLEVETSVYEIENGGLNTTTHKFHGRTRSPNLILKKGINNNNELFKWFQNNQDGKFEKKNLSVVLLDSSGIEIKRWDFLRAFPCRWKVQSLDVHDNSFPIEIIEIAYG